MLYKILKVVIRFVLNIFYRKLYISGIEHINPEVPQLLASNHPNGFMEPLIMACYFPRPLHFLVRGDVFDKKWLRPILIGTNQIPIFRFKDGFSKLRENALTMDASTQLMLQNNLLLIYAEGSTENIKQLRPLQKGIARIAFSVLEANPETNLEIVPSGVNFTHPPQFGKVAMLRVSAPLKIKDYAELYHLDQKAAYQRLQDDIYVAMKPNVVHLDDLDSLGILEDILSIDRSVDVPPYLPVMITSDSRLDREITIAKSIDKQTDVIKPELQELKKELRSFGYTTQDLTKSALSPLRILALIIGFPLALAGLILNGLPIALGIWFTKTKVSHKEFIACIWMNVTFVFFLIYYIVLIVLTLSLRWPWYVIPVVIISGLWLRWYYDIAAGTVYRISPSIWKKVKLKAQNILNRLTL